tara:strand:- start:39 stop:833 length:795 start_codon:yes stop_codon:yes gene_type:complete
MAKGGSRTSEVKVPQYIEDAGKTALNLSQGQAQVGYTPYYGPDVAAFTPMQEASFQNTSDMANAFGMSGGGMSQQDTMGGMGPPTQYANGVSGYSSAPIFEQSLEQLAQNRPGQKDYMDSFFIDPVTGEPGSRSEPVVTPESSGGGGTVICTAMHNLGLIPDDIYALDAKFGLKINLEDPMVGDGYRLWALPIANYIQKDTMLAKIVRTLIHPIVQSWAKEMAHKMRPEDYKRNYAGKAVMAVGHPVCRVIGYVFIRSLTKKGA